MKIAVISDLHFSEKAIPNSNRRGEIAAEILEAALKQINTEDQPDILLIGGDLVNSPQDVHLLDKVAALLPLAQCPVAIIPGNHDPEPEIFYQHLPRPQDHYDIKGIRIIPFPDDQQIPIECNAVRSAEDMKKMCTLADGRPAVILQHVPIFRFVQDHIACPYNYHNAEEIIKAAETHNITLSISGHYHLGILPFYSSKLPTVAAPSLCEFPFRYMLCELDDQGILQSCTFKNTRMGN